MWPNPRIPYQMSSDRPRFPPLKGKPLMVNPVVAIEYWPFDRPMPRGILPAPHGRPSEPPDVANYSWVEYGMRCGLPRLFDLFERRGIKASAWMNAQCADVYPSAAERAACDGWDFVGHSWFQRSLKEVEDEEAEKPDMHADFNLPLPMMRHTEFPHYYRHHEEGESEEAFATRMADALEALITAEGPETVAAFFAEPVMGAGGAIIPPKTYFEKIQAVLRKHDVLFIADEVICGFGRTGNWWGSETFKLKPDMLTCAKALSAAYQPISAVLINEKIHQAMLAESDKLGAFAHGYTYSGHPVATAVALEVLKIYEEMDVNGRARRLGRRMIDGLQKFSGHPLVGDVAGVG